MRKTLMLLAILAIANLGMAQEVRRPTGRMTPSVVDPQCQYLESIWGSRCEITPERCLLLLVPLFVETTNHRVVVKLVNNLTVELQENIINFNAHPSMGIKYTWEGDKKVKWVEWYTHDIGKEYPCLLYTSPSPRD